MFDDKPIIMTRHARNRLRRTTLSQDDMVAMVRDPARSTRRANRINLWANHDGGWLRIVVVDEADAIVVVTVIWPAREPPRDAA